MFGVERVARGHRYLYLVESVREGKTVRQRTIKALGRKDALMASGELDNAKVTPLQAVLRYRDLLEVESLFRAAKASFDTRPIFHQSDAAIRGHVFCSFLALTLAKELTRLCEDKGLKPEWQPLLNDLDPIQQATIEKDGKLSPPGPCHRPRSETSSRPQASRCRATTTNSWPDQHNQKTGHLEEPVISALVSARRPGRATIAALPCDSGISFAFVWPVFGRFRPGRARFAP
nr:hypothetical protein [Altericroceibacterium xinjiangense]